MMHNWVQFAMEFSKKAPTYVLKLKTILFPTDKSIIVVISEYLESITVKEYLLKNSSSLLLESNQESYTKLVRRLVYYMTQYITLFSAIHPPIYLPMCSLSSIYISTDLEKINLVYIPLFLYQIQCVAENCRQHLPAEVLDENNPSIATSMYSLGICLLQLLTVSPNATSPTIESYLSQLHDPVLPRSLSHPQNFLSRFTAALKTPLYHDLLTSLLGPAPNRPLCQEVLQRMQWNENEETFEHSYNSYFAVRSSPSRLDVNVSNHHLMSNSMEVEPISSSFSSSQPEEPRDQAESATPIDFYSLNLVFVPQDGTNETEPVAACFVFDV